MKKKCLWLLLAVLPVFLWSGCKREFWEEALNLPPTETKFTLAFHDKVQYPRGESSLEQVLRTMDGRRITVNTLPLMSSRNILEANLEPVPGKAGYYYVSIKPDQRGRAMWVQISANFQRDPVILVIDGAYYAEFVPKYIGTEEEKWIKLPMEFDAVMAECIVKYARANYRYYNAGTTPGK